jgi:hypothetical protein
MDLKSEVWQADTCHPGRVRGDRGAAILDPVGEIMSADDRLSRQQLAQIRPWADRWIEIIWRSGAADRARFETAVRECYRIAGLERPGVVVWTSSPLALCLAGPTAELVLDSHKSGSLVQGSMVKRAVVDATRASAGDTVAAAVELAVTQAVDGALGAAVNGSPHSHHDPAVETVTDRNVHELRATDIGCLAHEVVDDEVRELGKGDLILDLQALLDGVTESGEIPLMLAVERDVDTVLRTLEADGEAARAAHATISKTWNSFQGLVNSYLQYWEEWGPQWSITPELAVYSFLREICSLDLALETREGARAYEDALAAAGWWWPHERFVIVSERPLSVDGHAACSAMRWPDGWSV